MAAVLLGGVLMAGIVGLIAVSAGVADPTRTGPLAWTSADGGAPPVLPAPPYSLEAESDGREPWGLRTEDGGRTLTMMVWPGGYGSVSPSEPDWYAFPHVRPGHNQMTLDVGADGAAVLRINDEIAWNGLLPTNAGQTWRGVEGERPVTLRLYTP